KRGPLRSRSISDGGPSIVSCAALAVAQASDSAAAQASARGAFDARTMLEPPVLRVQRMRRRIVRLHLPSSRQARPREAALERLAPQRAGGPISREARTDSGACARSRLPPS